MLAKSNADSWEAFTSDNNIVIKHGTSPVLVVFDIIYMRVCDSGYRKKFTLGFS